LAAVARPLSNVIGFDDAPFARDHRGDVTLVGAICARTRLDGVVTGKVRRDGRNATARMIELVERSQFGGHLRAVILQGIAVAGFNVIDVRALHHGLQLPVLVVARRRPDLTAMRRALLSRVPGGARKWALIEAAGEMEPLGGLFVQRAGMTRAQAEALLRVTTLHGKLPEPVRLAHLIAGAIAEGRSRGRA
jgi:endonuclease V-like protein UPF0215 family